MNSYIQNENSYIPSVCIRYIVIPKYKCSSVQMKSCKMWKQETVKKNVFICHILHVEEMANNPTQEMISSVAACLFFWLTWWVLFHKSVAYYSFNVKKKQSAFLKTTGLKTPHEMNECVKYILVFSCNKTNSSIFPDLPRQRIRFRDIPVKRS